MRTALLLVATILAAASAVRAQVGPAPGASLDQLLPLGARISDPRTVSECDVGGVIDQIARACRMATGFENLPQCPGNHRWIPAPVEQKWFTGMTVRQVLDQVVAATGRFRWKQVNGVVTVRPNEAWDDPANVLNLPTEEFTASAVSMDSAVDMLTKATKPPVIMKGQTLPHPTRDIDRPFSVSCRSATMMEALNDLVSAHGAANWQLGYMERPALVVSGFELSGGLDGGYVLVALNYGKRGR